MSQIPLCWYPISAGGTEWETDLTHELSRLGAFQKGKDPAEAQLIFVDAAHDSLEEVLAQLDRKGRAVILVVSEKAIVPKALFDGWADDVLVHPFRSQELVGKFRLFEQIYRWDEVQKLNESFSELIERMGEDVKLAERIQKSRLPVRFPEIKGFRVKARYLAGLKPGGEYFDLVEGSAHDRVSLLLTDCTSYGLSSALLSVLMRVASKLWDGSFNGYQMVHRIFEELLLALGEDDKLSVFYGSILRKDLTFNYLSLGSSRAFHARKGKEFTALGVQGNAISRQEGLPPAKDGVLGLDPSDRLVLLSDGFIEAVGGSDSVCEFLTRYRSKDAVDSLNELTFTVKRQLKENGLPHQDCTGVIVDVDSKFLRVARS